MLATAWSTMTVVAWVAPLALADIWTAPVAACALAGLAAGAFLPGDWLRPRSFEQNARPYERIGIRRFKTVVVFGDLMNRTLRRLGWSRPFPYTPERIERWLLWTRVTERIHWSWLLGSLPAIYAAFHAGRGGLGAYVLCGNVPFNIYPILLQRYTRARLERILSGRS
jgi:Glycosyl-4,4'-diaponeurosporenoate acyltransferase